MRNYDVVCKYLGVRNSDNDAVYELDFVVIDCQVSTTQTLTFLVLALLLSYISHAPAFYYVRRDKKYSFFLRVNWMFSALSYSGCPLFFLIIQLI